MFAKLKKKIQEETGVIPSSPGSEITNDRRFTGVGPGLASPVQTDASGGSFFSPNKSDRDSSAAGSPLGLSRASSTDDVSRDSNSKEEVLAMLLKRTEQLKKLEAKISELAAMLKEKNRNIEKLEIALEKQQDTSTNRVQELIDKHNAEMTKAAEEHANRLQKQEYVVKASVTEQMEHLEQEKHAVEDRLKEAESYRDKYFKREEENDEFQGFTSQELAKVKHLLLNTQEDLTHYREELEQKTKSATAAHKARKDLENEVQSLMEQISHLTSHSEDLEEKNKRLELDLCDVSKSRDNFRNQLQMLSGELSELHRVHADLTHHHQVLQHGSDQYKVKTQRQLDEHVEQLHLQRERVQTLQQRLQDGELSDDDRVAALEAERATLETRQVELRDQLSQTKVTWSERVLALEEQITNLNLKMAEDGKDLSQTQKSYDDLKETLHKKIQFLEIRLEDGEVETRKYMGLYNEKTKQLDKQRQTLLAELVECKQTASQAEQELRNQQKVLQQKLKTAQQAREKEADAAKLKITALESNQAEWLEKEIDSEKTLSQIEERLNQSKEELSLKNNQLEQIKKSISSKNDEIKSLSLQIEEIDVSTKNQKDRSSQLQETLRKIQEDFHKCSQERDDLLMRNAELFQEMEQVKRRAQSDCQQLQRQVDQRDTAVAGLEQALSDLQHEADTHSAKAKDVEAANQVVASQVTSREVDQLRGEVTSMEHQLADKSKTIKMQQQRLTDLKKTLQRELKVQALPGDDFDSSLPRSYSARDLSTISASNSDMVTTNSHLTHVPESVPNFQHSVESSNGFHSSNSSGFVNSDPPGTKPMFVSDSYPAPTLNVSVSVASALNYNSDSGIREKRVGRGRKIDSLVTTSHMSLVPVSTAGDDMDFSKHVNFQYLRHVVLKFMLSRETEACHLIRAVSVLLKFTHDEQKLIKDTLEWKTSWFGTKPKLGKGQLSRVIHSSY